MFLLFGTCATAPSVIRGPRRTLGSIQLVMGIMFYVIPGIAYLLLAMYLRRRQFWAVVASLVLASIQFLLTLATTIVLVAFALNEEMPPVPLYIMGAVTGLVCLALAQLIYHLALSFEAIKHVPPEEQRGFEPLMPTRP